jgi:cell division protein FtsW (lipid II flippase)
MGRGCIRVVNLKIEEFVEEICSHVNLKRAHKEIRIELLNHIEEKTEDLILEGMTVEEASKKTLSEMGEAAIIGSQLNESHKAAPEWGILLITFIFSLLGLITAYLLITNGIAGSNKVALKKSIMFNIIGYIAIIALYFFDYKKLEKYSKNIFIGVTLALFVQLMIGISINGRPAWVHLGLFSVDITEISLFLYVIALSKLFKELDLKKIKDYAYLSSMQFIPFILFIQLKTSMAAVTYFVVFMVFMFIKKVKLSYTFSVIGMFLIGGFYLLISAPYRLKTLMIFINPQSDPQGSGYVNFQINKLLKSVGLMGNGFTFPKRAIPMVSTDCILTYIIYTFGWLAGIVLIILIFSFIIRIFTASREVNDTFGKYMIRGFLCIFALEFIWNILMILGFAPIVGITLPFISYGGSRLLVQMAAIGIIMSIYRTKSLSYA